jgi:hypothetical protein
MQFLLVLTLFSVVAQTRRFMKNLLNKTSKNFLNNWEMNPKIVERNDKSLTSPMNNQRSRFVIENDIPLPGGKLSNDDRQELVTTLQQLKQGESFLIRRELVYPVAMIRANLFRGYKLKVCPSDGLYRVFRVA